MKKYDPDDAFFRWVLVRFLAAFLFFVVLAIVLGRSCKEKSACEGRGGVYMYGRCLAPQPGAVE